MTLPSPGATGRLTGRTAFVTGGAAGIGRAVAERFGREGARVVVADRDGDAAAEVASAIVGTARAARVDISDEASVSAAFEELHRGNWFPDVVVANAGVQLFGLDAAVADLELDVWRRTLEVNLTGAFLTLKHGIRSMRRVSGGRGGSLIVTGSPTGLTGEGKDFAAYSASKAGAHGLARAAAAAYAPDGIRVNVVVPGYTETGLVRAISTDSDSRAEVIGRIPLGRAGTPEDLAGVMVFLASDESSFATGGLFVVDGGMTAL